LRARIEGEACRSKPQQPEQDPHCSRPGAHRPDLSRDTGRSLVGRA
jgi:hypothetical protein